MPTPRGQIHFWDSGTGPPLVLLAPAPRSARVYRRFLPLLAGFRALAIDTRGFGGSDPPDPHMAMRDYAEDVVNVLHAMRIERAHLFGLHTGNKIAAAMAAGWPARVDRVVLVGRTHSIVADHEARNAAIRASMEPRADRGEGVEARFNSLERLAQMLRANDIDHEAMSVQRDEVLDEIASWGGVDSVYAANFAFDLAESLMRVEAPTLVIELITSESDELGRQAPLLKALMRNCQTLEIHGHERTLLINQPERIAGPVVAFLKAEQHPASEVS